MHSVKYLIYSFNRAAKGTKRVISSITSFSEGGTKTQLGGEAKKPTHMYIIPFRAEAEEHKIENEQKTALPRRGRRHFERMTPLPIEADTRLRSGRNA